MKKPLIIILFMNLILGCSNSEKKIVNNSIEGVWFKQSEIIFTLGTATDTILYDGFLNEIYANNYYITLVNNVNLDSITMEDKDLGFAELSMGMSSDYLIAIKYLSTYVRVGSSIFGQRS